MVEAIADTGFVVALGSRIDVKHRVCAAVYEHEDTIYLPQTVLAEVGYMLGNELGNRAFARFLRRLPETKYRILALEMEDFLRTAELLEQYADTRVDFVDATIAAVAERLNIQRILTLDQRDFHIIRPKHRDYFEILPSEQ
ncbi:MAG: PIN domain-containing protein [Chloroflexi bacterium]|nr:PIN domain-containing protein [Chloroflexota bacterium]